MPKSFPDWLRRPWPTGVQVSETKSIVDALSLHTVCQSARCPNMGECWAKGTATVMVLGNVCTRNCTFCSVASGEPEPLDPDEPQRVAQAVRAMGLKHAVVTTVVRDDLADYGAAHIADTVRAIRGLSPTSTVEVLVSDFRGNSDALNTMLGAAPEVFGHNIETVRRIYPQLRDRRFTYEGALDVLRQARDSAQRPIVKSALMAGLGESSDEVAETLVDLYEAGCEAVCIGQYLQPSPRQRDVFEYVHPSQFDEYEALAYEIGFQFAVAGPFVRSSYRAEAVVNAPFAQRRLRNGDRRPGHKEERFSCPSS